MAGRSCIQITSAATGTFCSNSYPRAMGPVRLLSTNLTLHSCLPANPSCVFFAYYPHNHSSPRLRPPPHHFTYPVTEGVVGAPQMTSQPDSSIFSVLHCPLGLGETQVVFPSLFQSSLSSSPFHCALQAGFGQSRRTTDALPCHIYLPVCL